MSSPTIVAVATFAFVNTSSINRPIFVDVRDEVDVQASKTPACPFSTMNVFSVKALAFGSVASDRALK
jgi:hypothetical protein